MNDQQEAQNGGWESGLDPAKAVAGACESPAETEASFGAAVWGLMARSSQETRQLSFNFSAFLAANCHCQMARRPMFVYPDDGGDTSCALIEGFLLAGDGGCHCLCFSRIFSFLF